MENEKLFIKASDVSVINHYYIWLVEQVDDGKHYGYSRLLKLLHNRDFYWSVPNDVNRADDGKALRYDYLDATEIIGSDIWLEESCSVFEVILGIAKRLCWDIMPDLEWTEAEWFWVLIENLELDEFDDEHFSGKKVDEIIKNWLDRRYENEEKGSIFSYQIISKTGKKSGKTKFPRLEMWYQMHMWIEEAFV